jgi:quaternary ammonium compound-resistance protein SugE
MPWIYVCIAGIFEVTLTLSMKYADGFRHFWPTVGTFASAGLGFLFLGLAVKSIPVGTAYAVWVSLGIVGTSVMGIVLFREPLTAARVGCILLILLGVVGLKLLPPT